MTEFEDWWVQNYKGQLGPILIEDSFKEVAKASWEVASQNVELLEDKIFQLEIHISRLENELN